ncbi:hypothetical protein TASIC1_0001049700 [Trichoderma asperellum]|uniref:Uncharacterized protein n=1 Tax=Trichoderma asperellum TaxID=101201 RepID=A0A6V8QIS5_TRIAP|nr:hypothetical protein LI328DRAFT_123125 [Trichoderma asperelloides]GFP52345.1 hypothetical protein TASIC1_0001049700 [Trichoderma asperellum]
MNTSASAAALGSTMRNHINMIPKDNAPTLTSPPPAYTPPQTAPALALLRRQMRESFIMGRSSIADSVLDVMSPNEDDEDDEEGFSTISLRINTSVHISSNNNLVCLNDTPASHANAIAKAVVQAIQENSSGQCGIPMIDEDGRPRPVKIEVDAGITVEGSGNIVGNEDVVNQVLRMRSLARKRSADDDESDTPARLPKRRREENGSSSSNNSP